MPSKPPSTSDQNTKTEAEKRQERLAEALRANLRRRKAQKRGRADGDQASKPAQDKTTETESATIREGKIGEAERGETKMGGASNG